MLSIQLFFAVQFLFHRFNINIFSKKKRKIEEPLYCAALRIFPSQLIFLKIWINRSLIGTWEILYNSSSFITNSWDFLPLLQSTRIFPFSSQKILKEPFRLFLKWSRFRNFLFTLPSLLFLSLAFQFLETSIPSRNKFFLFILFIRKY